MVRERPIGRRRRQRFRDQAPGRPGRQPAAPVQHGGAAALDEADRPLARTCRRRGPRPAGVRGGRRGRHHPAMRHGQHAPRPGAAGGILPSGVLPVPAQRLERADPTRDSHAAAVPEHPAHAWRPAGDQQPRLGMAGGPHAHDRQPPPPLALLGHRRPPTPRLAERRGQRGGRHAPAPAELDPDSARQAQQRLPVLRPPVTRPAWAPPAAGGQHQHAPPAGDRWRQRGQQRQQRRQDLPGHRPRCAGPGASCRRSPAPPPAPASARPASAAAAPSTPSPAATADTDGACRCHRAARRAGAPGQHGARAPEDQAALRCRTHRGTRAGKHRCQRRACRRKPHGDPPRRGGRTPSGAAIRAPCYRLSPIPAYVSIAMGERGRGLRADGRRAAIATISFEALSSCMP